MKICKNCGTQLDDNATFCGGCGTRCEAQAPKPSGQKIGAATLVPIIVSVVCVVLVAAMFFSSGYFNKNDVETEEIEEAIETEALEVTEEPIPEPPAPVPEPVKPASSYYRVYRSDVGWETANYNAYSQNGRLVSINSSEEFNRVCSLADNNGLKVFWVGARRAASDSWNSARWNDGSYMSIGRWYTNEPSYRSEGIEECYLMVFKVNGVWYYNDAPNEVSQYYAGKMGYIVEFED
ncbi:MAG: zinc-ribbon domain-containing protein [Clostridia bacterium]|nr:zinc-ribbon domain-containing protein [Clostridia bacterium]